MYFYSKTNRTLPCKMSTTTRRGTSSPYWKSTPTAITIRLRRRWLFTKNPSNLNSFLHIYIYRTFYLYKYFKKGLLAEYIISTYIRVLYNYQYLHILLDFNKKKKKKHIMYVSNWTVGGKSRIRVLETV